MAVNWSPPATSTCGECRQTIPMTHWCYCPMCGSQNTMPFDHAKHAVIVPIVAREEITVIMSDDRAIFNGPSRIKRAHDYVQKYADTYEDNDKVFAAIKERTT